MSNYPEWLTPFLSKGVYASKRHSGYVLYRAHSERVPGKKSPVLRYDGYIGTVTEKDGLKVPTPSVRPGIEVYRYGFYAVVNALCHNMVLWPERKGINAELVFTHCALSLEGYDSMEGYRGSWLSVCYPGLNMDRPLGPRQSETLSRMTVQMNSKLDMKLREDRKAILDMAANVYAVYVNGQWKLSSVPHDLADLAIKHGIPMDQKGLESEKAVAKNLKHNG